ncbi:MAG: hypothetical protein LBS29_04875 [Endomicrobium sp.]|jgi:hypothetical protein|nr:hypothetical protein [Endomicrobium sp.]
MSDVAVFNKELTLKAQTEITEVIDQWYSSTMKVQSKIDEAAQATGLASLSSTAEFFKSLLPRLQILTEANANIHDALQEYITHVDEIDDASAVKSTFE